jgi:O-antigen/teichoic acid export membrane protein
MSSKRVVRSFAVLASSNLLMQIISFVALAIVARRVGPEVFGAYAFTLAVVTFVQLPITSGITNLGVRDVAKNPARVREIAGEIFALQLLLALALYVVIVVAGPLIAPTEEAGDLMPIVGLMLFTGTSFEWTLQGLQDMRPVAVARLVGHAAFGLAVPFFVVSGYEGIERYAWLFVGGLVLKQVLTVVFLVRAVGWPRFRVRAGQLRGRLRASLAMGFAVIMVQIYYQIDLVMLGYLSTAEAVGEYGVAYRIPTAILAVGTMWGAAMFPHSAALADVDRDKLRRDVGQFAALMTLIALPLAACAPFVAEGLMTAMFGDAFADAGTPFALLMVAVGLSLIAGNFVSAVLGMGGDKKFALGVTLAAMLNVGLNLFFIPWWGTTGAALATIAAEILVLTYLTIITRRLLGGIEMAWGRVLRVAGATVPAVASLALLHDVLPALALVAVGGTVYVVSALALKAIRVSELNVLLPKRASTAQT